MHTLLLPCDFSIFKRPPLTFTETPVYSYTGDLLTLQIKFKTTPLKIIDYESIINSTFKVNNLPIPEKLNVFEPNLFIQIYNTENNQSITLKPQLDGFTYIIVTAVSRDVLWRVNFNFEFKLKSDNTLYKIQVVDNRDFNYTNELFPSPSPESIFPNAQFNKIALTLDLINTKIIYPTVS